MRADPPTVTVIVPALNAERTIAPCVASLLGLRYPSDRLELCVVDNGSSDRTAEVLRGYGEQITIVHEPRRGRSAARNAGLRQAGGEVVAFTDADCVADPGWLGALVAPLEDRRVAIAGGEIRALAPANRVERFGEEIHDQRRAIEAFDPPYVITMSWASPRELLLTHGGFDETLARGEDVDLAYRLVQAGYRLAFAPGAVVFHRNEPTLPSLFWEGFAHGFHGVRVRKRHAAFLHELGHRDVDLQAWRRIGAGLVAWASGRADHRARCQTAFDAGKRAGKLLGSARFGQLDI